MKNPQRQVRQVFNDILGFRAFCDDYHGLINADSSLYRIVDMSKGKSNDDGYRGVHLYYQMDNFHHEYVVLNDCEVLCYVDKGIVAPGFGSLGGAVQYRHYMTIFDSIIKGLLKEDYSWLERLKKKSILT